MESVDLNWKIKIEKGLFNHWNRVHCGASVLDWSKSIMNTIMVPLDKHVLYTDTDSLIVRKKALEKFLELQPQFYGKGLGQFKYEFHIGGTNRRITKLVIVMPKVYAIQEEND